MWPHQQYALSEVTRHGDSSDDDIDDDEEIDGMEISRSPPESSDSDDEKNDERRGSVNMMPMSMGHAPDSTSEPGGSADNLSEEIKVD